ncbi:hypothetical protein D3C76_1334560 [compost metagenome]
MFDVPSNSPLDKLTDLSITSLIGDVNCLEKYILIPIINIVADIPLKMILLFIDDLKLISSSVNNTEEYCPMSTYPTI